MTDEAYCFRQTERETKRIARGVYSKKCGKRSKKCSLPSDYMTAKERKAMNGKAESFNIGKPMDKASFKKLPDDLKREYIFNLADKYEARAVDIANMLGYSKNGFWNICNQLFAAKSPFRGKHEKAVSPKWLNFINPPSNDVIEAAHDEDKPAPEVASGKEELGKIEQPKLKFEDIHFHAEGDPWFIFSKILGLLESGKDYHVYVAINPIMEIPVCPPPSAEPLSNF